MILLVVAAILLILLIWALLTLVGLGIHILLFLAVAALCAAVAEYLLGMREGILTTVIIGVIGSAIGVIIQHLLNLPVLWTPFGVPIVWTIVGSLILVVIVRLVTGRRRHLHWV